MEGGTRTEAQLRSLVEKHVLPEYGDLPVTHVSVYDILSPIWHAQVANADKLKNVLKGALDLAVVKDYIAVNPWDKAKLALGSQNRVVKNHPFSPIQPGRRGFDVDRDNKRTYLSKRLALRFLILTASRTTRFRGRDGGKSTGRRTPGQFRRRT